MEKELCPQCKSEDSEPVTMSGRTYMKCNNFACNGRVSGGWFHWDPGHGLKPKPPKKKKEKKLVDETSNNE